jgi:hypothetical protein
MAGVISKVVVQAYGLRPGSEIDWQPAADVIRLVPAVRRGGLDREARLRLFDLAIALQRNLRGRRGHGLTRVT